MGERLKLQNHQAKELEFYEEQKYKLNWEKLHQGEAGDG
jgi:hypothetical protein